MIGRYLISLAAAGLPLLIRTCYVSKLGLDKPLVDVLALSWHHYTLTEIPTLS